MVSDPDRSAGLIFWHNINNLKVVIFLFSGDFGKSFMEFTDTLSWRSVE